MFVIEGLLASVVGLYSLWFLADKPQDASWMSPEEKEALKAELDAENATKPQKYAKPWKALLDLKVLYLTIIYFTLVATLSGIVIYMPTQIAGLLGKKVGLEVGLITAIPYLCACIALLIIPPLSDKTGKRGSIAALMIACSGLGVICSSTSNPVFGVVALCFAMTGCITAMAIFWALPSRFLYGVAAASGIALINSLGNGVGGFFIHNFKVWAEYTFHDPHAGLYAIGSVALMGAYLLYMTIPLGMGSELAKAPHVQPRTSQKLHTRRGGLNLE